MAGLTVQFDESVSGKLEFWKDAPHITLYIDDCTVMEEVTDLTTLRKGDHCIVGLNPIRKMCGCCDGLVFRLASWEILRLYHHFIMFEDVKTVDRNGMPLNADAKAARICEYSNTLPKAYREVRIGGLYNFIYNMAPFHKLALYDYLEGRSAVGIYRIVEEISQEERDRIVSEAEELMTTYRPYDLFFRNCEHAAFGLKFGGKKRWVSPQIPWVIYNLLRWCVQLIGCFFLYWLANLRHLHTWPLRATLIVFAYNMVSTVPVALQILVSLVRATVLLTEQRKKLGELAYFFLLSKEVARAVTAGGSTIAILALLPRLVWTEGWTCWTASWLLMTSYSTCDTIFNVSARFVTSRLNASGMGIPVAVFASTRRRVASPASKSRSNLKFQMEYSARKTVVSSISRRKQRVRRVRSRRSVH